jgi:hypothetical protein
VSVPEIVVSSSKVPFKLKTVLAQAVPQGRKMALATSHAPAKAPPKSRFAVITCLKKSSGNVQLKTEWIMRPFMIEPHMRPHA